MCSHLARNSEVYFEPLMNTFSASRLGSMLVQLNSSLRSKACNLIGNLCRHSSTWYPVLLQPVFLQPATARSPSKRAASRDAARAPQDQTPAYDSLLSALVHCCADADDSTRKFACFAVGNAAFHSSDLYPHLAGAIPPLLSALDDSDEKTRANAAGALGNLVRNGSDLASDLCAYSAVDRLVLMCLQERVIFPQVFVFFFVRRFQRQQLLFFLQRIALFSLGTMAAHPQCRYPPFYSFYSVFSYSHHHLVFHAELAS